MNTLPKAYTRKSLWLYMPLWLYFVYLFYQLLTSEGAQVSDYVLYGMEFIALGIHEAAHLLFIFLPNILVAAAGSAAEIVFTILIIIAAFRARSYFAMIFGGLWSMQVLNDTGQYMADSRTQVLPTIGPSPDAKHDWNFIFSELGWLQYDTIIGRWVSSFGDVIGAAALLFGLWLLVRMAMNRNVKALPLKA